MNGTLSPTQSPIKTKQIACVDETTEFTSTIDCVFVGDIDALTISERDMTVRGFKTVYNDLQTRSVCDSLQRLILNVSVPITVESDEYVPDPSAGEFVLRYEVTGSCRGCTDPVLFDDSINRDISESRLLESLGRELETCTCPAEGEQRGLDQVDFIDAYQLWIDDHNADRKLENLSALLSLSEANGEFVGLNSKNCSFQMGTTLGQTTFLYFFLLWLAVRKWS